MTKPLNKKRLIADFRLMQDFERSARDLYLKISKDPFVQQAGIHNQFKFISQDEDRHIRVVETIIELIDKKL